MDSTPCPADLTSFSRLSSRSPHNDLHPLYSQACDPYPFLSKPLREVINWAKDPSTSHHETSTFPYIHTHPASTGPPCRQRHASPVSSISSFVSTWEAPGINPRSSHLSGSFPTSPTTSCGQNLDLWQHQGSNRATARNSRCWKAGLPFSLPPTSPRT